MGVDQAGRDGGAGIQAELGGGLLGQALPKHGAARNDLGADPGESFIGEIIEADLVFLAMGFLHPEQEGLIKELRLATDNRDNIAVDNAGYTANSNLFACGDAVSGASLVVKAMASGRNVARSIDRFLQTN